MAYTIANAKDDLEGILGGTTVNNVTNINSVFARAGRRVLSRIDPAETVRSTSITIDDTFVVTAPADLKDGKIRDIFITGGDRATSENPSGGSGKEFAVYHTGNDTPKTVQVKTLNGTKNLYFTEDWTEDDYTLEYFSDCMFRTSDSGTWSTTIPSTPAVGLDNTLINLGTSSWNIFLYECALVIAQQSQGEKQLADIKFFTDELFGNQQKSGLYAEYLTANPNEAVQPQQTYYRV